MSDDRDKARAYYFARLRAGNVADHLHRGLVDYIVDGVPTGSFLQAALENNLSETFGQADRDSLLGMFELVCFLYNVVPIQARKSPEKVQAWIKQGGLMGEQKL